MGKEGRFQEAIDFASKKYNIESGKYDPNDSAFASGSRNIAITDMTTGEVKYGPLAFSERSMLQRAGFHEGAHVSQFRLGKVIWDSSGTRIANRYSLEVDACRQTLNNAWKLNLTKQAMQDERGYLRQNLIKASRESQGVN